VVPGGGKAVSVAFRSTRMTPLLFGVGLPNELVWNGVGAPLK
jgi:hypothetical protein